MKSNMVPAISAFVINTGPVSVVIVKPAPKTISIVAFVGVLISVIVVVVGIIGGGA